jgi:hypothetical protein
VRYANVALRFFLELDALAALAYWGVTVDSPLWPLFAVAAPLLMAVFWGQFMSPKAPRPLHDPLRLAAAALHLALTFVFGRPG